MLGSLRTEPEGEIDSECVKVCSAAFKHIEDSTLGLAQSFSISNTE